MKQYNLKDIKIGDIKFYKHNATLHPPAQIEKIKKSIDTYGLFNFPAVDKNNILVSGEGRVRALLTDNSNQFKTIQVIDLSGLEPKQINKIRILDNTLASGDFDPDKMEESLNAIFNDINANATNILEEMDLDISFLIRGIKDEESKPRSGSTKTASFILDYSRGDYEKVKTLSNKLMKASGVMSLADLFLYLLENNNL